MKVTEYDDISINGQFDLIFKEICPSHPCINWKLLKSLAFNESELQSYVEGGLFRIPNRLYYEFDGRDPNNPEDSIKTVFNIFSNWWNELDYIKEEERLLFVVLAYKLKFYNVNSLTKISNNFSDMYNYFSPGLLLEVRKIVDLSIIM
jgi:hypothetical protein